MSPFDWLTGEEVDPEELEYREQLRQAVASGEIQATPTDDGNWEFADVATDVTSSAFAGESEPLPEMGGTYQSQSTPSSPTALSTLHPETPMDVTPTKSSVDAAKQIEDSKQLSLATEQEQKYSATPGQIDPGYDKKAVQDFQSLSPDWQEFERNLDTSYPGMSEDEIDAYINGGPSGDKLNSASKSIIENTAPPEGTWSPNTPFKRADTLDPVGSVVRETAEAATYLRNKTYIPYVTPFLEKEVAPAVGEAVRDTLTGDYLASGGDLSRDSKGPVTNVLEDSGFGRAYLKVADTAGSLASTFTPTHGLDFLLEAVPGVGDARGLWVANKEARGIAATAGATRLAWAETVGQIGPEAINSLATRNLRSSADDILADAIMKADPNLTKNQVLTMINGERMAGRMLYNASENVAKMKGDELVTVYHATDADSAANIQRNGFNKGSFVTIDPEAASLHAIEKRGVEAPVILKWEIPRNQLYQSKANPIVFTSKDTWGRPTLGTRVVDVQNTVRNWLKESTGQPLAGERGSFRLPGSVADEVPDDVARLAFGEADRPLEKFSASNKDDILKRRYELTDRLSSMNVRGQQSDPEYRTLLTELKEIDDSGINNLTDQTSSLELNQDWVHKASNDLVNDAYESARREASGAQDRLDELERQRYLANNDYARYEAEGFSQSDSQYLDSRIESARESIYRSLAQAQRYGEELYRRTNGAQGMPEKIASSIRKMIGAMDDESGIAYIWGVGPAPISNQTARNVFPAAYGAVNTAAKLPWGMQQAKDFAEAMIPKTFNQKAGDKPGLVRKVVGGIVPGYNMPRVVMVADRARSAIESRVSEFTAPLARAADTLEQEFLKNPPKLKIEVEHEKLMAQYQQRLNMYNQHVAASAAKKLPTVMIAPVPPKPLVIPDGTKNIVDYLERWWEYDETVGGLANAALIKARDAWDEAADGALVRLHDEFGIDIEPYYPRGPMGQRGSYVPHMESVDEIARKRKEDLMPDSSGRRSTAKEDLEKPRRTPTIRERIANSNDPFVPETELYTIAARYGQQMANAAGKHTYDRLLGGQSLVQLFEANNPKLLTMRRAAESRVQNTRNALRNINMYLREAGIDQKRIQREIDYVRRRESKAAGRIENAAEKGAERIAKLQDDLEELTIQAKAYDRLVARVQKQLTDKNARYTTTREARDALTKLQQTVEEKLDYNLQAQASQTQVLGAAPTTSPVRIKNNITSLKGKLQALKTFDSRLGSMEASAANRIQFLEDRLNKLETMGRGITDSELAEIAEKISKAETSSIKEAVLGIGAQREAGVTLTRLNGKLDKASKMVTKRLQDMADKQTKLFNELGDLGTLRERIEIGKDAAKKGYALDKVTHKYVPVAVANASERISSTKRYGIARPFEEARAVQLSTGDFSPLVYGRAQMGLFGYTGMLFKIPMILSQGVHTGEVWKGVDQSMLQAFQMLRGRAVDSPMAEIRPDDALVGLERLGRFGQGVRKINDTLNNVATFGEYTAWEISVRNKLRERPNLTLVQAGAEVMKAMENTAPRVDFQKLGYSPAQSRILNLGFTSLSYMASTPQFTVSYSRAWGKLAGEVVKNGANPLKAWRALGVADQETLIHGSEMLSSLAVLSGATAALWGDESMPIEERVLNAMSPVGKGGWELSLPYGQSIPLAVPLRSGIRASVSGAKGVVGGLGGPTGAMDAVSPGVQGDFLAPANYLANRLISLPSIAYHMAFNKDFRGDKIITKEGWGAMSQALLYGLENATIVTSPAVHAARTGEVGNNRETIGNITEGWGVDASIGKGGIDVNVGINPGVKGIVSEMVESQMGLNIYDPSISQQWRVYQKRAVDEMIKDGSVPPDMAQYFNDTDINEMPSSFRKLIDDHIKENYPDNFEWYQRGRRKDGNIFQTTADRIDELEQKYATEKFDVLFDKLMNGDNPETVWKAYDTAKAELRGAKNDIYENKEYNNKITGLEIGDMRKLEDAWNAITDTVYRENGGALDDDDYSKLAQKQVEFLTDLKNRDPDTYKIFNYHLDVQEQRSREEAHPMEKLRKDARDLLVGYYAIPEDDAAARGDWLEKNPEADFMKWMTVKSEDPGLNSVAALEKALNALPERKIHLSGSNQYVTASNLPTFKKYDKEITRLLSLPSEAVYQGEPYNPRQELMKQSPLYEALWFWLGMVKPDAKDENKAVSLYHPEEVLQYSRLWGGRTDKVNVKRK